MPWAPLLAQEEDTAALEQKTADEAFAKADQGNPDPSWQGKKFTIAVLASGPRGSISGPYYYWRPHFEQLTGATYDIAEIPRGICAKIFTDMATGQGIYDAVTGPMFFMGDYLANGWIIPIDKHLMIPGCRSGIENPSLNLSAICCISATTGMPSTTTMTVWVIYYRRDLFNDPKCGRLPLRKSTAMTSVAAQDLAGASGCSQVV